MEVLGIYLAAGFILSFIACRRSTWLWQSSRWGFFVPYALMWPICLDMMFCDDGPMWRKEGFKTPEDWKKARGYD